MDKNNHIDNLDKKILSVLVENAKTPFLEVAKMCNVSGSAIHQRVNKLIQMGVITGSHFSIDPKRLGFQTLAYVGVYLENARVFDEVLTEIIAGSTLGNSLIPKKVTPTRPNSIITIANTVGLDGYIYRVQLSVFAVTPAAES